jgi:hypothetical protein
MIDFGVPYMLQVRQLPKKGNGTCFKNREREKQTIQNISEPDSIFKMKTYISD